MADHGWKTVESAPRDGSRVLAYFPKVDMVIPFRRHDPGGTYDTWVRDDGTPPPYCWGPPSLWLTIPKPPHPDKEP